MAMKTTLDLPDDLVRQVRLRAIAQNRTMKDLVSDFLRRGLDMYPLGQSERPASKVTVEIGEHGLPVIRCGLQAPAAGMSVEDLLRLEQAAQTEEDLQRVGISL
jgi:plasmid stability protein